MNAQTYSRFFGLAGVSSAENPRARKVARFFEWPMIGIAIWILIEWNLTSYNWISPTIIAFTDWFIWGFFLAETVVLTWLVENKGRHLLNNWINLLIIVFGLPVIWWEVPEAAILRALRLVVLFSLLFQFSATARDVLKRNHLGATLQIAFLIIVISGFVVTIVEPSIDNPWDGIWWAWVTVTTVGYGDIVPESMGGRLFASILILLGIGLFSLLTANFSALLIVQEEEKMVEKEDVILEKLQQLDGKVSDLAKKLEHLESAVMAKGIGSDKGKENTQNNSG